MVIAYHLVWTAYGTWLPNDPRGSTSKSITSLQLADLGPVHYGRKKLQPSRGDVQEFYSEAATKLSYSILRFDASQLPVIAKAFEALTRETPYTCYACAIMPDHLHLIVRKHRHSAEEMIARFQAASREHLVAGSAVPPNHPVWTDGGWKTFLDSAAAVRGRVRYVENNPAKAGLPSQKWTWVVPYDGWPHAGRRG